MTITKGFAPKYRCSACRKIHENRHEAEKCCPEQAAVYVWTHKKEVEIAKISAPPEDQKDVDLL